MDEPGTILLLIDDLFFSVKVEEVAKQQDFAVRTAGDARSFQRALVEEELVLAIVNLAMRGADATGLIRDTVRSGTPVLAFGPHVDKEAHQAARDAGARASVTNSQLMRELPALIQQLART